MPRIVADTALNASTLDILNVIRENASFEYQNTIPKALTEDGLRGVQAVGEALYGHPAMANEFINALINRIAIVRAQSITFNNPYRVLKKGYLEFGETVEELFVNIAKAVDYNPEQAEAREFKRYIPDIKAAFHIINWRVMYPVTIQDMDLHQAFQSMDGVQMLIGKIVDAVYKGAEYDEFLLFKYMLIKALAGGKITPYGVDTSVISNTAVAFRGISNSLIFVNNEYNYAGVDNNTPKSKQVIFMDAMFNAQFDVDVLSSAFNMDKADFMGRLFLIDNWTKFDNKRFDIIRQNSDGLEEVTQQELSLLADVKAVVLDEDWFQVYDNMNKFTEKYAASGLYWNYFYHTWKTVSSSPFANAVAFISTTSTIAPPASFDVVVSDVTKNTMAASTSDDSAYTGMMVSLRPVVTTAFTPQSVNFVQDSVATAAGIGVTPYGTYMLNGSSTQSAILCAEINGVTYHTSSAVTLSTAALGSSYTFKQDTDDEGGDEGGDGGDTPSGGGTKVS